MELLGETEHDLWPNGLSKNSDWHNRDGGWEKVVYYKELKGASGANRTAAHGGGLTYDGDASGANRTADHGGGLTYDGDAGMCKWCKPHGSSWRWT